jgi:hypothetical protein
MRTGKHWLNYNLWQKPKEFEKNFLMPLWLPHELTKNWTQTAAVMRLVIAWAMAQPDANEESFSPHWIYCDVSLRLLPEWNQSLSSDCHCVCHTHQMKYIRVWIYFTPVIAFVVQSLRHFIPVASCTFIRFTICNHWWIVIFSCGSLNVRESTFIRFIFLT